MLGVSKGVSTELICTKSGCQKALAVHSSPLLASAQSSGRVEGEMIPTQLELDANKHSVLSWLWLGPSLQGLLGWRGHQQPSQTAGTLAGECEGHQVSANSRQLGLLRGKGCPMVRGVAGGAELWDQWFVALSDTEWLTEGSHA